MMRNRLDKLFSDQLSKHREKPSSNAWGQIHDQLNRKRKILWFKKIGIAASFLLLISIGYFGYYSSNGQTSISGDMVAESVEVIKGLDRQSVIDSENKESKKKDFDEIGIEDSIANSVIVNHRENKLRSAYPKIEEEHMKKYDIKSQKVNKTQIPEKERNVIIEQQTLHENKPTEILQTSITEMESPLPVQTSKIPEKSTMKIKIIYKASKDSRLLDDKKSYLDRGVDKINNFSSKHLLTEDRKKILRNTKEDLLALNFGKLFKN